MESKVDVKMVIAGITVFVSIIKLVVQHRGQVNKKNV